MLISNHLELKQRMTELTFGIPVLISNHLELKLRNKKDMSFDACVNIEPFGIETMY